MISISARNFRSLQNIEDIELRPITLLVGENSTGKSSFLALINLMFGQKSFPYSPNFNLGPFELGGYDSIASRKGPKVGGKATSFAMGFKIQNEKETKPSLGVNAEYVDAKSQPGISQVDIQSLGSTLTFEPSQGAKNIKVLYTGSDGKSFDKNIGSDLILNRAGNLGRTDDLITILIGFLISLPPSQDSSQIDRESIEDIFRIFGNLGQKPSSFAMSPIRSKPRRTYDLVQFEREPEGSHVPYIIAEELEENEKMAGLLERFGKSSGLFHELAVKRHGKKPNSPFMLSVKDKKSHPFNLVDVGYGVSQALPIAVDSIHATENILLIQQPEVHLHPQAQIGLGDFFSEIIRERKKTLVIETHSDYLIDRLRILTRKGQIKNTDIRILFFEKRSSASTVHQIDVDGNGNLVSPPKSYSAFFLKHQNDFLGN